MFLVKTDALGNQQWSRTFGGTGGDGAYSVLQAEDGGYVLAGYTWSFGAGGSDMYLVKTDAQGNQEWSRTFGGTGIDSARTVARAVGGGYVLAGNTWSFGAGSGDMYLVKTDEQGNEQWSRTFGGSDLDRAHAITADYALAGRTDSFGADNSNMWLVKTGPGHCAPAQELTIVRAPYPGDEVTLSWQADSIGSYEVWRTENKNNDGDPNNGSDPDWTLETTLPAPGAPGPMTYNTTVPVAPYYNYLVVHECAP